MPKYKNADNVFLGSVIVACGGFFFVIFIVFLCAGKKKKKNRNEQQSEAYEVKEHTESANEVVKAEVIITVESYSNEAQTDADKTDVVKKKEIADNPVVEALCQYDPVLRRSQISQQEKSQSDDTVDPYETFKHNKPDIQTSKSDEGVKENSSTSGSGNSDSGGGIYARVKNVPKAEEIAYAVVDMKESQEKYETLNGDIVRRHRGNNSFDEHDKKEPNSRTPAAFVEGDVSITEDIKAAASQSELSEEENSGNSGLYASVSDKKTTSSADVVDNVEHSDNVGLSSEIHTESSNRNSSLYASVSNKETMKTTSFADAIDNVEHSDNTKSNSEVGIEGRNRNSSLYASVSDKKTTSSADVVDNVEHSDNTRSNSEAGIESRNRNSSLYASVSNNKTTSSADVVDNVEHSDNVGLSSEIHTESSNRNSSLYASVSDKKTSLVHKDDVAPQQYVECTETTTKTPTTDSSNVRSDVYAVVCKPKKTNGEPSTDKQEQENSGGSGVYAAVSNEAIDKFIPASHPDPPALPPHPVNMTMKPLSIDHVDMDYEYISNPASNSLERDNTYDSISDELKVDLKKNQKRAENNPIRRKDSKIDNATSTTPTTTNKKHGKQEGKSKHNKSAKDQGQGGPTMQSPKTSKFFRANPFKHSKKHKKSAENIHVADVSMESNASADHEGVHSASDSSPTHTEKNASLPSAARKSNLMNELPADKRHSLPNIPPPLPSVDKLKHLTEHNRAYRKSSIDTCSSPETSPKSSPRTPSEKHAPSLYNYHMKMSPSMAKRNVASSKDSILRRGETVEENVEEEEEEEEKYSTIIESNKIKINCESNGCDKVIAACSEENNREKSTAARVEENSDVEDNYCTVKDELKDRTTSGHALLVQSNSTITNGAPDSVEKYVAPVQSKTTLNDTTPADISHSGDNDVVTPGRNGDIQASAANDIPDYAMVSLTKKYLERSKSIENPADVQKTSMDKKNDEICLPLETEEDDGDYETVVAFVDRTTSKEKKELKRRSNDSDYMLVE